MVLNTAMTVETYNGTPAQSQVVRDKTVATNESSSEKKEGWNSRGAKKAGNVKKSTVGKSPKTVRYGKTIHSERSGA